MTRERPILMRGPLVVASLEGRKTQTRRVVQPWPDFIGGRGQEDDPASWGWSCPSGAWVVLDREAPPYHGPSYSKSGKSYAAACPYGVPGDRLVVREAWQTGIKLDDKSPTAIGQAALDAGYPEPWAPLRYPADGHTTHGALLCGSFGDQWGRERRGIHMPRWASRLTLVIDDVRVQRVQAITEEDARAEGVAQASGSTHRWGFAGLWDQINGKRPGAAWADHPWTWCISYHVETSR